MIASILMLVAAATAEPKTAQDVLEATAHAYAGCATYHDSGKITVAFEGESGSIATTTSFTTEFVRPDRFRFECAGSSLKGSPFHFIVWRDGHGTHHWSSRVPGVRSDVTFEAGVESAATPSVSNGASAMIPSLLLSGEVESWGLAKMESMSLGAEAAFGHECFKVSGKFATNERTLWIDKKSLLIRRVEELIVSETTRTRRTVDFEPAFNEKIDDAKLAPGVPEAK
ncbi:MAG TPA: hypothetical protein VFV19_17450 [Candidatus Polarisedimenticolaceae bacterium]|nr:hypothetical protein [Candidatus Polarisedimenticolaceae bacterium]